MSKKRLIFGIICIIVYIVTIIMLVYYSMESGDKSIESSSGITNVVGGVVDTIVPDKVDTKRPEFASLIRKLFGHFGLFTVNCFFGLLGFYLLCSKKWLNLVIVLPVGMALAVITEVLQLHAGGRNYSVRDMFINSGGCLFGLCIAYLFIYIYNRKNNKKSNLVK